MRSCAIASGSQGNCFVVESKNKDIYLIDIGLSYKKLCEELLLKDIDIKRIKGIFLTHEHTDHIAGLEVFMKNNPDISIYLTKGTFDALGVNENKNFNFVKENEIIVLDDMKVFVLSKSHDANEPVNYIFENGIKTGIFTDLGFVNSQTIEVLKNLDVIYFETNFCEEYIKEHNYPGNYISRLHSDLGHLSVQDSVKILSKVITNKQRLILSHISQNTTTYENAYRRIKNALNENNIFCDIYVSFQSQAMDWIE